MKAKLSRLSGKKQQIALKLCTSVASLSALAAATLALILTFRFLNVCLRNSHLLLSISPSQIKDFPQISFFSPIKSLILPLNKQR